MSEVKVNKISPRSGTTITLGDSGDTFTVPSGVTFDASSGGLAGTLTTAAQPNITSVGTLTSFTSTGIDDNATSTAITIDSSQRVGIGETDNSTYTLGKKLVIGELGNNDGITLKSATNSNANYLSFGDSDNGDASFRGYIGYRHADNNLVFGSNSSERMRITSAGRLGIGTTAPDATLEVNSGNGDTNSIFKSTDNNCLIIISDNDSSSTIAVESDGSGGVLKFNTGGNGSYANNSEAMRIDSSGKVGIANTVASSFDAFANDLVVGDGASSGGVTVYSGTGNGGSFNFADGTTGTNRYQGYLNYDHSEDAMKFYVNYSGNTSPRMTIDSSGNVGIGITNPNANLNIVQASNTQKLLRLRNNTADTSNGDGFTVEISDSSSPVCTLDHVSGGDDAKLAFSTNRTERMRIDSSGNLLVNCTSTSKTSDGFRVESNGIPNVSRGSAGHFMQFFDKTSGSQIGRIENSGGTATSYVTSSDYRLKENISYDFDATTRLKQLKPARFNFISNANTTVDGFLAHEVSSVVPEAITGTKDALQVWEEGDELPEGVSVGDNKLDENGNTIPEYQGIDQSKLVPLLVKTIQELEARITALENA